MPARDRAQLDIDAGDLGMARQRLVSRANSLGYNAELIESIARLAVRMGDLAEAGRWYYLCDSQDTEAPVAMARFLRSCGDNPDQAVAQLPLKRYLRSPAVIPQAVRQRLEASRVGQAMLKPADSAAPVIRSTVSNRLFNMGCMIAIALFVILAIIGWIATIRYFRSL